MARTTTVTVLFCDLVGSTALQSRIGDDAADDVRRAFFGVLRAEVEANGGSVVKTMGDGAMAAFADSAVGALRCAVALTDVAGGLAGGLQVRVGVSHGEVTAEDGDLFGTPVVEAARLESAAAPGTVLASEVVRVIVGSRGAFAFDDVPPLTLKGLPAPMRAVRVGGPTAPDTVPAPSDAPADRQPRGGRPPTRLLRLRRPSRRLIVGGVVGLVVAAVGITYLSISIHFQNLPATAAGSTQPPLGYTPRFVSQPCPSAIVAPGPGVSCGELVVPEDRTRPTGAKVHLLVVRAAAQTAHPAADPVIDVGDPTTRSTTGTSSPTRLYSEHIELFARGTTGTTPALECPEVNAAQTSVMQYPPLDPRVQSTLEGALATCRARLIEDHIDPNDFGADAAAADVRDLMSALHIKQADLSGDAYSGQIVFDAMRHYPSLVRTATIEDAVPPGVDPTEDYLADLSAAIDRYAVLCDANSSCRAAFPDIRAQAVADYNQLQQHPVTEHAEPTTGGPPIAVFFNGDRAARALQDGFEHLEYLPLVASEVYNPDVSLLAGTTVDYCCTGAVAGVAWGAVYSYLCKDFVPNDNTGDTAGELAAYPQFVGLQTINPALCAVWNVRPDDADDTTPLVSTVPTFLYSGALDPDRSPQWSSDIAQGISHAVVLEFPTMTTFTALSPPVCLSQLRVAFLRDPTGHFNAAKCEAQPPPIVFAGI